MSVLTGADGRLVFNGLALAKIREWSLTISKDPLEDTCLGDFDRSFVEGLRNTTGTATVLYDPSRSAANSLLNTILLNDQPESELVFELNRKSKTLGGGNIVTKGFLTSVSSSVSVGSVSAVTISFQVNGKPVTGAF
jgi:hypothetical protein